MTPGIIHQKIWTRGGHVKKDFHVIFTEKLPKSVFSSLKKNIQEDKNLLKGKVYFSKLSNFPRYKFKEAFPFVQIVRNPEEADVILVSSLILEKRIIGDFRSSRVTLLKDGRYADFRWDPLSKEWENERNLSTGQVYAKNYLLDPSNGDLFPLLEMIQENKKVILDDLCLTESISGESKIGLDSETSKNIKKFLESDNYEDIKLGMKILLGLPYDKYSLYMAYMYHSFKRKSKLYFKPNLYQRQILTKLKEDYPFVIKTTYYSLEEAIKQCTSSQKNLEAQMQLLLADVFNSDIFDIEIKITRK